MFARCQNLPVNLRVQVVGRAVVNHLQSRMGKQFVHAAVGMRHIQRPRLFLRLLKRAVAQGDDLHNTQPTQGLDMRRADKAAADDPDVNHARLLRRNRQMRGQRPE
ncbi:hypothetical protein D3C72_929320 [compost metagenome]